MLASLEEVKETQRVQGRMLQEIIRHQTGQVVRDGRLPEGATFPLNSYEFSGMEARLADQAFAEGVVSSLC